MVYRMVFNTKVLNQDKFINLSEQPDNNGASERN